MRAHIKDGLLDALERDLLSTPMMAAPKFTRVDTVTSDIGDLEALGSTDEALLAIADSDNEDAFLSFAERLTSSGRPA